MTGAKTRPRVLVTRPEPEASRTSARLAALGYDPLVLPLFQIVALEPDVSALPAGAGIVAVTSANAVRHVAVNIVAAVKDVACFCVGAKTAEAARVAGFANVVEGGGDAESLAGSDHLIRKSGGELSIFAGACGDPPSKTSCARRAIR